MPASPSPPASGSAAAERDGLQVRRYDIRCGPDGAGEGFESPVASAPAALDRFYDLLLETGERRQFTFGPRESFVAWWTAAHAAGHLVLLEATPPDSEDPVAGLVLYRHGGRFSTVHSGDHAATRETNPGALHLLRWRAIQLAIRERCTEMDLGGVDTAEARGEPKEGDPLYGLYQHKKAFGGQWLELTGAHQRVHDAPGYALGRAATKVATPTRRQRRRDDADPTIAGLLAAAEPTAPAALAGLVDRLIVEGRLRGARRDGRAIGPAGLADVGIRGVTNDSRGRPTRVALRGDPRSPRRWP